MALNKQKGNMFNFVTHTWNPLAGECLHKCSYCYVDDMKKNPMLNEKYSGNARLIKKEMDLDLGVGKTIFVENMGDLFQAGVPSDVISQVLKRCNEYPDNTYLFHTKNPLRYINYLDDFPPKSIFGCTIETNRDLGNISKAPKPLIRGYIMAILQRLGKRIVITIEPILKFDDNEFLELLELIKPEFVSLGADSKKQNLDEPTENEIKHLIQYLDCITDVKIKINLRRLAPFYFSS